MGDNLGGIGFGRALGVAGIVWALGAGWAGADPKTFTAEGTDAVFGLGARYLAMGGTGTATADDTFALYYNPAGLAGIDRPLITLGRQLDATLRPLSFMGFAMPLTFADQLGADASFAIGRYPRIHAHSTGAFGPEDFESIFLRFLLPGIKGTYDGEIDSKTLVNRFALGVQPHGFERLSLGANIDLIDCRTNTCGVKSGETRSVHATAVSFGLSARYRLGERVTLGAMISDVSSGLRTTSIVTNDTGEHIDHTRSELPMRAALEASWQARDDLLLALGAQSYFGAYGKYSVEIDTLHFGAEWQTGGPWALRAGAWAPLKIYSSQFETPDLLAAVAPTMGVAWRRGAISADLAVFAHPLTSMHEGRPVISEEFSLTLRF
jgi:hypothetical protein